MAKEKGVSLWTVSANVGVGYHYLNQLLRNGRTTRRTLYAICDYFGKERDYFNIDKVKYFQEQVRDKISEMAKNHKKAEEKEIIEDLVRENVNQKMEIERLKIIIKTFEEKIMLYMAEIAEIIEKNNQVIGLKSVHDNHQNGI